MGDQGEMLVPSCPLCGAANQTTPDGEQLPIERLPRDYPLVERYPWMCHRCATMFDGTADESRRMRDKREAYQKTHEKQREKARLLAEQAPGEDLG